MDLQTFQQCLEGANSQNHQQTEFNESLMRFHNECYGNFVSYSLETISNPPNPFLLKLAILTITQTVKSGKIFEFDEIANQFSELFVQLFPAILQNQSISYSIKISASIIISNLAIHHFQNAGNTLIQEFILRLFESNPQHFETYILSIVEEIIRRTNDLGGFTIESIQHFLTMPLQMETSYIYRFKLFFASAPNFSKDYANLSQLLKQYLENPIPEQYLRELLNTMTAFAEYCPNFFLNQTDFIIPFLINVVTTSTDSTIRNCALFCIESIVIGLSIPFQNSPENCEPIIQLLIQIISEIDDNIPLEYDANCNKPCVTAQLIIDHMGQEFFDKPFFLLFLESFYKVLLSQVPQAFQNEYEALLALPWPQTYSIIAAYTAFHNSLTSIFTETQINNTTNYTHLYAFFNRFLPLIGHPATNNHVRLACIKLIIDSSLLIQCAYDLIQSESKLSKTFPFLRSVLDVLFSLFTQQHPTEILLSAAHAIQSLIPQGHQLDCCELFPQYYDGLIQILSNYPPIFYKTIVESLSRFIILVIKSGRIQQYLEILVHIYNGANDLAMKFFIIRTIGQIRKILPGEVINPILINFLTTICQIKQESQLDEYYDNDYYNAIRLLFALLDGSQPAFYLLFLDSALKNANEDITIEQRSKLEHNDLEDQIEIKETKQGIRNLVEKSEVKRVARSLAMMNSIADYVEMQIKPRLEEYLNTITKWIYNDYEIPQLISLSFSILKTLMEIFAEEQEMTILISLLFDVFLSREFTNYTLINGILKVFLTYHELDTKIEWCDAEKVKNAVGKLDQISRFLISKCGEQITFRLQNSASLNDKNICHVTDAIWPAGDTFSAFLDLFPEITVTYINENMMDFLNGLVNTDPSENQNQTNDYTLDFVLQVLTKRLLVIKNLEESIPFIQTLYRIGTSFQGEISFIGFKHMTYFLSAFPLPPQIASELAEQFSSFIESIPENDEDGSEQYKGYSMSAFAVLLDKNRDSLDYETLSYQFLEFLPILDEWLTATYLYDYIATLILEKNPGLSSNIDTIIHDFVYKVDKFNIEELTDKGLKALRAALIDPALHDLVSIDLIQAYNENPTNQLLKTLIEGIQT